MKVPVGTTTISGQSGHSLKVSFGFKQRGLPATSASIPSQRADGCTIMSAAGFGLGAASAGFGAGASSAGFGGTASAGFGGGWAGLAGAKAGKGGVAVISFRFLSSSSRTLSSALLLASSSLSAAIS